MQIYDILMLVVLVGGTLFGAWKGMAWQIASLCSFVVSYLVALSFATPLAPIFGDSEPWNRFVAMLVLYVATSMAIWLAFRLVASAIDRVKLKEFDRQIGALFGACKGVLFCIVITFFAVTLSTTAHETVLESQSGHYIAKFMDTAHPLVPDEVHQVLHPYFEKLEEKLNVKHAHLPGDGHEHLEDVSEQLEDAASGIRNEATDATKNVGGVIDGVKDGLERFGREFSRPNTSLELINPQPIPTSNDSSSLEGVLKRLPWTQGLQAVGSVANQAINQNDTGAQTADPNAPTPGIAERVLSDSRVQRFVSDLFTGSTSQTSAPASP